MQSSSSNIDDTSLARYGQWPWPRSRLAQLLRAINASGAASIGLDLILAEPDRTSPGNSPFRKNSELQDTPSGEQRAQLDHDLDLADTLAQGPFILGHEFLFGNNSTTKTACTMHPSSIAWINIPDADLYQTNLFKAQGIVCNRQIFADAVTNSGFLNAATDPDGILRRVPMLIRFDERVYPSLPLAMLMKFAKGNQIVIQRKEMGQIDLRVGNWSLAIDTQGEMTVRFSHRINEIQNISAADLLNGVVPSRQLNNKFVLVGFSAAGLGQVYQTPAGPVPTHADVHAQVLNNILTNQQVIRTVDFPLWEALIGLLIVMCTSLSIAKWNILSSAAACITFLAGTWIGTLLIFQIWGYLLSPLLPTVLVTLNFALLTIIKTWKIELAARKNAEETLILLKSSERNLDSIIKTIPDVVFRLDTAGRITFISPAISKYIASPHTLLGQPIFNLVAPEDLQKAQYRLNEKRTGERATHDLELRLLLPHGYEATTEETRHFSISAEGLYQSIPPCPEKFIGTQGIIRDITEQKKLEEKLLYAQKLEVMGSLAARVAHDLNNILAGLVTYPDLLLLELPPDSPLRDKISLIQRSGKSAAAIVQDLLTLGRRGVKTNEVVDLNGVLTDYLASLEFTSIQKNYPNVTVESSLSPVSLKIKGSRVHIVKAVMNLLINAAEAMPAGGTIRMSLYNRFIDAPLKLYEEIPPGEYACISVTDEGIGIAREDYQKIFEPFYSRKSMKRSGSGLGMTVIWATIKDHGGYIDLQSHEGEGTLIALYIPTTREQEESLSHRIVLEDYIGREQLLVVDDMPEQLKIATSMLTKLGYTVATAVSGEAAVEYLRSQPADLVILDMIMPGGMDGLQTYKKILEIRKGQKAIIASGFSESAMVKALQQLGAGAYVQKPYTLEKLGVAVRKELDSSNR